MMINTSWDDDGGAFNSRPERRLFGAGRMAGESSIDAFVRRAIGSVSRRFER
jgi:hypothetical protein